MTVTHKELDLGMSLFLELIQADPSLAPDVASARAEYFPGDAGYSGDPRSAPAAEVRFLEWFLFERDHQGGLLVDALMPSWREVAEPELALFEETFLGTCAGIYEVGDEAGDGLHWLRDVAGLGEYAVEVRATEGAVHAGDLIVGRLFPKGDSTHALSPGAGCFSEEELIAAVYRDLEAARRDRAHKALRIRQVDLEAMFWGDALSEEKEDPVKELSDFLQEGGLSPEEVDGLIEVLAKRPVPKETAGPFFISSLQDLLDHLAFETDIDLTLAQGKFLSCWLHLHGPGKAAAPAVEEPEGEAKLDPQDALKAFDADRAAGLDSLTAISRLSSRLGIDADPDAEQGELTGTPPVGLVGGLIEEYLWDLERTGGERSPTHDECLGLVREDLNSLEVIEDLTPRRLLLFACTKLCEGPTLTPDEVAAYAEVLSAFSAWCVEHHGHTQEQVIADAFDSLPGSLARVNAVNKGLDREGICGDWLSVAEAEGELCAETTSGDRHSLACTSADTKGLCVGDFIRGQITSEGAALRWCYPPELAAVR